MKTSVVNLVSFEAIKGSYIHVLLIQQTMPNALL